MYDVYPDSKIQLVHQQEELQSDLHNFQNCDSQTIHSLLQWNLEDNSFGKNEDDPLISTLLL